MFLESLEALLAGAIFTALLMAVARSDLIARRVPNALVVALLVGGCTAATIGLLGDVGPLRALTGAALGFAAWLPFWLLRLLGAGDVKLATAIGAWLGPWGVLEASLLAALAGGVLALAVVARRRRLGALASGFALWVAALRRGELTKPLVDGRAELLPYGVALAVGATLTGWLPASWVAL